MAFSFSPRWLKRGAFSLLNRINVVFFGFWNIFFMVRLMSVSEVGVWSLFISVTTILELLRNGFIRNPLITHVVSAETEAEKERLIGASWFLHVALVAGTSLLMLAAAVPLTRFWEAPQLDVLFYIYIARAIVLIPCLQFEYLQQAAMNFYAIFFANVVRLAPPAIYLAYCFFDYRYFGGSAPTLVDISLVQLGSAAVSAFAGYYFVRNEKVFAFLFERAALRRLANYGKFTLGTTISSMFIKSTDTWMIGRLVSTVGVGLYNPALRISNLIEVPTLAVASVVFPQINKKLRDAGHAGLEDVYVKSVSVILAMMIPAIVPLYVFSDLVITLIFGDAYIEAAAILRVTIFYTLIIPFNRQFGTMMDALKRPQLNFYLLLVMGVLNVIFNYFLILRMGPIGAAYGTLLSYLIIFVANQVILYKLFGIRTQRVFPAIVEWYLTGWSLLRSKVAGAL